MDESYYIDTHCHIDFDWFDEDREAVVERALRENVRLMINIGCDYASNERVRVNSQRWEAVYYAAGIHPSDVDGADDRVFAQIREYAQDEKMVAVGEIGLDYFKYDGDRQRQRDYFTRALQLAIEVNKPVVIHNRDSHTDLESILNEYAADLPGAVLHCFAGTPAFAERMIALGCHLSFTGNITFKNANYDPVLEVTPIDRIMLETDSPFLTPHPFRGKRNEPARLPLIAEKIASVKEMSVANVQSTTTATAMRFFRLTGAAA